MTITERPRCCAAIAQETPTIPAPSTATSICLSVNPSDIHFDPAYINVKPPSTGSDTPVTCEASFDNKNATTAATSSGSARRDIGLTFATACHACASSAPVKPVSLRVKPGTTTLAVAPEPASSIARHFTSTSSAAFAEPDPG